MVERRRSGRIGQGFYVGFCVGILCVIGVSPVWLV